MKLAGTHDLSSGRYPFQMPDALPMASGAEEMRDHVDWMGLQGPVDSPKLRLDWANKTGC